MLAEDVPTCLVCSNTTYDTRGGSFSPGLQQQGFRCSKCGADAEFIALGSCAIIGFNLKSEHFRYINTTLFAAWRDRNKKIEDARSEIHAARVKQVNAEMDLAPETTGYDLMGDGEDEAKMATYRRWCDRLREFDEIDRDAIRACAIQIAAVVPPRLPLDMLVYNGSITPESIAWTPIDPKTTSELVVPPDPIRVAHDKFFDAVFARIRTDIEFLCETEHIQNQYYKDESDNEPWFRFGVGSGTVVIGPRKRVIAIRGERALPFDVTQLRDAAARDGVTWYNGEDWQSKLDEAKRCEIHAYGQDKTVEYLKLLITSLRGH